MDMPHTQVHALEKNTPPIAVRIEPQTHAILIPANPDTQEEGTHEAIQAIETITGPADLVCSTHDLNPADGATIYLVGKSYKSAELQAINRLADKLRIYWFATTPVSLISAAETLRKLEKHKAKVNVISEVHDVGVGYIHYQIGRITIYVDTIRPMCMNIPQTITNHK